MDAVSERLARFSDSCSESESSIRRRLSVDASTASGSSAGGARRDERELRVDRSDTSGTSGMGGATCTVGDAPPTLSSMPE